MVALLLTRGASQGPIQLQPHVLQATVNGPTLVPCGYLPVGTTTWSAEGSPYILPVNTVNDPSKAASDCPSFSDPPGPVPPGVVVRAGSTLVIDAKDGPVQIFSHGAGISLSGGALQTANTSSTHFVSFDAEPDVASWDGIAIHADQSGNKGNAALSYSSVQHALTSITIDSGSEALGGFGLTLNNVGIGPSYFDGIDATNTPLQLIGSGDGRFGTVNNIGAQGIKVVFDPSLPNYSPIGSGQTSLQVQNVVFGSSVPFAETSCVPLQPCAAGTIGDDAIQGNFTGQPGVKISGNQFFRASSFALDLQNMDHPQVTFNDFVCNGSGSPQPVTVSNNTTVLNCTPNGSLPIFSAIYMNNVTADLLPDRTQQQATSGVSNNVGQQNGLDALVFSGSVSSDLQWKTPSNDPRSPDIAAPHALGYMVANLAGTGSLEILGKTLRVGDGDVVKAKGGGITLTGGSLDASSAGLKTFTSVRDNGIGIQACPSVFAQSCLTKLPPNEWAGIDLVAASGRVNNANILFPTKGIMASGQPGSLLAQGQNSYGLVVTGSRIGPTFSNSIEVLGVGTYVDSTSFCRIDNVATSASYNRCVDAGPGDHGISADYSSLPVSLPAALTLVADSQNLNNFFKGSVNEAISATGLRGERVDIEDNLIQAAGSSGIALQGADTLTLQRNTITSSGLTSPTHAAIYLNGVSNADFSGPISSNAGSGNGLDAIVFHGSTANGRPLNWQTVGKTNALGYVIDGDLAVNGDFNLANGDQVPVLQGTITVKGGTLSSNGATFTSLKDQTAIKSCGSVFVLKASGVCPAKTAGDWGGLVLDPSTANVLTDSNVRYAATGISVGKPLNALPAENLTLVNSNIASTSSDGIHTLSPVSVSGGAFTSNGGSAISVDLTDGGAVAAQPVRIIGNTAISATGKDGILGMSLTDQTVQITSASIDRTGGYGIHLQSANKLTLTDNAVMNSAAGFAAIYIDGFNGDFANVSGNRGAGNGLDALAFHGTVTGDLNWQTARKTSDPTRLLGYLLDQSLTMTPGHTLSVSAGDIVKVGNGGTLQLEGVTLKADDTSTSAQKVFTSLSDNSSGVAACPSQLLPGCTAVASGDWVGINLTGTGANGSLVNAAVRYALTGIRIDSGSPSTVGSSSFGLVLSRCSISSTKQDAIDSMQTAVSVTDSTITGAVRGVDADFSAASTTTPLRLSGNRFTSTSAEAILGEALAGQPVVISDNRIQGAATYGIRLLNADDLVLRNNNVSGSGGGPSARQRYPAVYLPGVTGDFVRNIRGNVGSNDGLDAVVFDGSVTGDLPWITPKNDSTTHALGYLLDANVQIPGKLSVRAGDVVKVLAGTITINGGTLDASGAGGKLFTTFKDNSIAAQSAPSCPSVFVTSCIPSLNGGEWGGLVITENGQHKGSATLVDSEIDYAATGIAIDSGPFAVGDPAEPGNFRLAMTNGRIAYVAKDAVNALDTPISIDGSTIQSVGGHGIIASFFSPANCSSLPPACKRLAITNDVITSTGKDAILANGLSGQPTFVTGNTVSNAGTYGIRLVSADTLALTRNTISTTTPSAPHYPPIYLSAVKADFEPVLGSDPMVVAANAGFGTGLDAIVFHGEATKGLTWLTPGALPANGLGYLLDGGVTVDGTLSATSGADVVKVLNGGIKINGGSLQATGATFTSLKDSNSGLKACSSVFIPSACDTQGSSGDWTGINIDATDSHFDNSKLLYSSSGLTMNSGVLHVNGSLISRVSGYAVSTAGSGTVQVDCTSIHDNGGGILSQGGAGSSVSYSNFLNNNGTDVNADANNPVATTAANDWWGSATPSTTQYSTSVTVNNPLPVEPPTFVAGGGSIAFASDNTNKASGDFGKGTLTVTLTSDREVDTNTPLSVNFQAAGETSAHTVTGSWQDNLTWVGTATIDPLGTVSGGNTLSVNGARSCIVDGNNTIASAETQTFNLDFGLATVAGTGGANNIGASSATLTDSADPNGWSKAVQPPNPLTDTYVFFQYHKGGDDYAASSASDIQALLASTPNLGTLLGYTVIGNGSASVPVSVAIPSGTLDPSTLYDYRLIAVDLNGIAIGTDQQFTTTGTATTLQISDPSPEAGTAIDETVSVLDSSTPPRVVADYSGSVKVDSTDPQSTWKIKNSTDSQAAFPAQLSFTPSDLGSKTLSVVFKTAGVQTLTASATGLSNGTQAETVSPAPASQLAFTSSAQTFTAGGVSGTITVQQQDPYGNAVNAGSGGLSVTLSSDSSAGAFFETDGTTALTNPATIASGTDSLAFTYQDTSAGTPTLTAAANGLSSGTQKQTVNPAAAGSFVIAGYPASTTAGDSHSFTVTAKDSYGNTATGYTGTVDFSSTDSQSTLPSSSTLTNGAGSFNATLVTAGTQSITAEDSADSSITGSETGISVAPAATSVLQVNGYPTTTTAGDSHDVAVTARDAYGNLTPGYAGKVQLTSSDGKADLPSDYTFVGGDNGSHSFSVVLKTAGPQSITATDATTASIKGSQSGITVTPAATSALQVSGYPSTTTAGDSQSFAVSAVDTYGNVTPAYTGTIHFTSSDGQAVLPTDYTFGSGDQGSQSFTGTLKTAGNQSITATDTTTSSIQGAETGIEVDPAATSQLVFANLAGTASVGTPTSFTLNAEDQFGNVTPDYAGTVTFTSTDTTATLPTDYTFSSSDHGIASNLSVTFDMAGSWTVSAEDTVTATIAGQSAAVVVS